MSLYLCWFVGKINWHALEFSALQIGPALELGRSLNLRVFVMVNR